MIHKHVLAMAIATMEYSHGTVSTHSSSAGVAIMFTSELPRFVPSKNLRFFMLGLKGSFVNKCVRMSCASNLAPFTHRLRFRKDSSL